MTQKRNILVAGATGLVGTNLFKRLRDDDASVRGTYYSHKPEFSQEHFMRCDLTDPQSCLEATRDMDDVIICAAQTFGAKILTENPIASVLPNLQINSNLFEACRLNNIQRVIFISSSTVYQQAFYPIREEELNLNEPPYELYRGIGWMNRYIEQLARYYYLKHNLQIGIVRPTNIYGPHDKFDESSHVLPALIKRALLKETPFVAWGHGHTVRDFLYVNDFIDDLLDVLRGYCRSDPLNISSGSPITIREAVKVILDVCQHRIDPVYDTTKPTSIPYRALNTAKFESLFGKKPRTSLREGIQKTVDWYKSQGDGTGSLS